MIERPNKYNSLAIPGYKPSHKLTEGGLGNLWIYRSEKLGNLDKTRFNGTARIGKAVVKFPNKDDYGDHGELNDLVNYLFETEAALLADLMVHPYLPPLTAFGYGTKTKILENGGEDKIKLPYIMMPFISGRDFNHILGNINNNGKFLPNSYITKVMKILFGTVLDIHKRGYLHNDLKLTNLIFNIKHGYYKIPTLLDLGISLMDGATIPEEIGTMGSIFSSPEIQSNTKKPLTTASDSYSLGLMFYTFVAQKNPISKIIETFFDEEISVLMENEKKRRKEGVDESEDKGVDERILELKTTGKLGSCNLIDYKEIKKTRKEKVPSEFKEIINGLLKENPEDRMPIKDAIKILNKIPERDEERREIENIEKLIAEKYSNFRIPDSAESRRDKAKHERSFIENIGK